MAREKIFHLARLTTLVIVAVILMTGLAVAQEPRTHTVVEGETLAGIAEEYDVTLESLLVENEIDDPDLIFVGQELIIPTEAIPLGETDAAEDEETEAEQETTSIADETAEEETTTQSLPADGSIYIVQPGDVLDLIAQELDISLLAIAYTNGLEEPYPLLAGQVLIIPTGPAYGEFPATPAEGLADGQGGGGVLDGQIYVVQPGDVLDSIAQTFDVSLDTLLTVNAIDNPAGLMPGDVLVIPDDAPAYGELTILNPELLEGLADGQGGGGLADEDSEDNEESSTTEEVYVVQRGDTILSIVNEQNVSLAALLRANPDLLDQITLEPDTELVLP